MSHLRRLSRQGVRGLGDSAKPKVMTIGLGRLGDIQLYYHLGLGDTSSSLPSPAGYSDYNTYLIDVMTSAGYSACLSGSYTNCPDIAGFQNLASQIELAWSNYYSPGASNTIAQTPVSISNPSAPVNTTPPVTTPTVSSTSPITSPSVPVNTRPTYNPNATYNPSVTFEPSRYGVLQPGDTWKIQVTGGQPNSPVVVTFSGNNPNSGQSGVLGNTGALGNFSTTGTIQASQVGDWVETYTVGGVNAGSFSFSVVNPTGAQANTATSGQSSSSVTGAGTVATTSSTNNTTSTTPVTSPSTTSAVPSIFSDMETWVEANPYLTIGVVGLIGAFLLFSGKKHR